MHMSTRWALMAALPLLLAAAPLAAQETVIPSVESEEAAFRVVQVAGNLEHPWSLAFLPDGGMLLTERPGRMVLIDGERRREISGLPAIAALGQGGLLDLALHPEFETNRLVYFSYVEEVEGGPGTAVARGRLEEDRLEDVETIFRMDRGGRTGRHFGSRLLFLTDGTLLVTVGERGERDRAQDLGDHAGSILRIAEDGSVPPDNPFVDEQGVLPEIYTYGNRNVQGIARRPGTEEVWLVDHGPRGGDELHVLVPGENYGWPEATFGVEYTTGEEIGVPGDEPGYQAPVTHWTPAIAPSGLTFYSGEAFPGWEENLFIGSLVDEHLRRVELDGDQAVHEEVLLHGELGRIRYVTEGPEGNLYLLTDEPDGGVYRLEPVE